MAHQADLGSVGYGCGGPGQGRVPWVTAVRRIPNLVRLKHFCASASSSGGVELYHFVGITPEATSLEQAFGVPLLERHSRGVKLTPAGEALYGHVQRILGNVDQMEADLSDHARGLIGVVRLWANTSAITQFLPGDLAHFASLQPGIRIELNEADSHEVVMAVLDGRADLGILADRTPALGLQTRPY